MQESHQKSKRFGDMLVSVLLILVLGIVAAPIKEFGEIGTRLLLAQDSEACANNNEILRLAGGCFWGLELAFQRIPGIVSTQVGYSGSHSVNPTYRTLYNSGHCETVQIEYNPHTVNVADLLDWFLQELHDPTTFNRQGGDVGMQYRSQIFPTTQLQYGQAVAALERFHVKNQHRATTVVSAPNEYRFWPAEPYHQRYLEMITGQTASKRDATPIRCYG